MHVLNNDPNNSSVEIAISGKGYKATNPKISVSQSILVFDIVVIGEVQRTSLYINNFDIYEPLLIYSITSSDSQFTVSKSSFTIAPQRSEIVDVYFKPNTVGIIEASLTIKNNDPDTANFIIPMVGEGREQKKPQLAVDQDTLKFAEVKIEESKTLFFKIMNKGEKLLVVQNIISSNSQFVVDSTNFNVAANDTQIVKVTFSPTQQGEITAALSIISNDERYPEYQLFLKGVGTELKKPQIYVDQDSLKFGEVEIEESKTLSFKIMNKGEKLLVVQNIISGNSQFEVDSTKFNVTPHDTHSVKVTFFPAQQGEITAALSIISNDERYPEYQLFLKGVGTELKKPQIYVDQDTLKFGEVEVGKSRILSFKVKNKGEKLLLVQNIITNNSQFKPDPKNFTVAANDSQQINVVFSPTQQGKMTAVLTIFSNAVRQPEYNIFANGTGLLISDPQLVYEQTELYFGKVFVGDSLTKPFILQNYGDRTLKIFNAVATDHFAVLKDTVKIEKLQSYSMYVTFFPTDTLRYKGVLQFQTNDPTKPMIEINLYGEGAKHSQQISVFPTHLTFENVVVHGSEAKPLLISNLGIINLDIQNVISDSKNFFVNQSEFTLEHLQTRELFVTFQPDSVKRYDGRITIVSNDPVVDSLLVAVTGFSRDSTAQQLILSADTLNFGTVATTFQTEPFGLTIWNTGEKKLRVFDVVSTDNAFKVSRKSFSVYGKASERLYLTFSPNEIKSYIDTLKIITNVPENDTVKVVLLGVGRERYPQQLQLTQTSLDFGIVATDRKKDLYLKLSNIGERDLIITSIESDNSYFLCSTNWLTIKAKSDAYVAVTFSPKNQGQAKANLSITTNDPENSYVSVSLTGTGIYYIGPRISLQQ